MSCHDHSLGCTLPKPVTQSGSVQGSLDLATWVIVLLPLASSSQSFRSETWEPVTVSLGGCAGVRIACGHESRISDVVNICRVTWAVDTLDRPCEYVAAGSNFECFHLWSRSKHLSVALSEMLSLPNADCLPSVRWACGAVWCGAVQCGVGACV